MATQTRWDAGNEGVNTFIHAYVSVFEGLLMHNVLISPDAPDELLEYMAHSQTGIALFAVYYRSERGSPDEFAEDIELLARRMRSSDNPVSTVSRYRAAREAWESEGQPGPSIGTADRSTRDV